MVKVVKMPQRGLSEESALIAEWHVKKGDNVKTGDILFSIETDKTTFEVESEVEGTILEILYEEGSEVPVLNEVCIIGDKGEEYDLAMFNKAEAAEQVQEAEPEVSEVSMQITPIEVLQDDSAKAGEIKISPRARGLADKRGIDFRYAVPTGPEGRIIERDIIAMLEKGPFITSAAKQEYLQSVINLTDGTGIGRRITVDNIKESPIQQTGTVAETDTSKADYEVVKLSNIRKVIAKNMQNSLDTTAQLTLNTSFDATEILTYRKKIKANQETLGLNNISLNDIILYAVSRTLLNYKELNAHFLGDKMHVYNDVHLGVAIDTERGLMVPTILNANRKSLNEISGQVKALAKECQSGSITADKMKNGSFTVTNLGSLGIESFTPVLNAPQTGILGVNAITQRAKEVNGEIVFYPAMGLSLTFDHKALDGAPAARFLQELKDNLENFSVLLSK